MDVPYLTDGVVSLRAWTDDDVPEIVAACADEEIARWLDQVPQPYAEADARAYVELARQGWEDTSQATYAVVDAGNGEVLGSVAVHRLSGLDAGTSEVGYWVKRDARGRGTATRALRLVSDWELGTGLTQRLQLRADALNIPSQRVAERAGFVREGVLRSCRYNARQDRRVDFVVYSLLPTDGAGREERTREAAKSSS